MSTYKSGPRRTEEIYGGEGARAKYLSIDFVEFGRIFLKQQLDLPNVV